MSYPSPIVWETVIYLLQVLAQLNFNLFVWFNSQLLELVLFNPDSFISMLISGFDKPADDAEQKSGELVVYCGG